MGARGGGGASSPNWYWLGHWFAMTSAVLLKLVPSLLVLSLLVVLLVVAVVVLVVVVVVVVVVVTRHDVGSRGSWGKGDDIQ